jgi:hypothetical protein
MDAKPRGRTPGANGRNTTRAAFLEIQTASLKSRATAGLEAGNPLETGTRELFSPYPKEPATSN